MLTTSQYLSPLQIILAIISTIKIYHRSIGDYINSGGILGLIRNLSFLANATNIFNFRRESITKRSKNWNGLNIRQYNDTLITT